MGATSNTSNTPSNWRSASVALIRRPTMTVIKKVIVSLVTLICVFATFCQIFASVVSYLNYNQSMITEYIYEPEDGLPSVKICGQKSDFVTDKYFEEQLDHPISRPISGDESDAINQKLSQLSVKEQFEATLSAKDLHQHIDCRMPSIDGYPGQTEDCMKSMTIDVSLNSELFCLTLTHAKDPNEFRRYGQSAVYLLSFDFKLKVTDLLVALHPNSEPLYDILKTSLQTIHWEPKKTTNIYFETFSRLSLSSPYGSCKPSWPEGAYTREECVFSHDTQLWQKTLGCLPEHYLYNTTLKNKFCDDTIDKDKAKDLRRKNYFRCPHQCSSKDYHVTAVPVPSRQSKQDSHTINILASNQLNKRVLAVPALTFADILAQISNLLCLWMAGLALHLLSRIGLDNTLTRVHSIKH